MSEMNDEWTCSGLTIRRRILGEVMADVRKCNKRNEWFDGFTHQTLIQVKRDSEPLSLCAKNISNHNNNAISLLIAAADVVAVAGH